MKRIFTIISALIIIILIALPVYAEANDFRGEIIDELSDADISDIQSNLEDFGISPSDPESVSNLSVSKILNYVVGIVKESLIRPLRIILIVAIFAAICQLSTTLSYKAGLYGELFVLICFIAISPLVTDAFKSSILSMQSCNAFMLAYVPVFAAIAAASGNLAAAASYNAVVLYFCEAAAIVATTVLKPILCCMLVLAAAQALNPDLINLTSTLRNALTTVIGFIMTLFLGVVGLQTIVGRGAEGLAVKAGKYAVSSFIPVIGYSLSESYKAVSLSLSAIRSAVGAFGIVVMCLYMLSPIISAVVFKTTFQICCWICRLTGADRLAVLMNGLADVFAFMSTVLLMFMLMLIVATGMLILLGGTMLA